MTTTVHCHVGLTAWASSTFTLGQRCSTGGNAYQCTTAGSSTSAPTGTGTGINNGGVAVFKWLSAITYTSLSTMVAAYTGTLADNVDMLVWNNGLIVANNIQIGASTPGAFIITMKPAPGEGWRDNIGSNPLALSASQGVMIETQSGYTNCIKCNQNSVTLYGLQISGVGNNYEVLYCNNGDTIVDSCLVQGTSDKIAFLYANTSRTLVKNSAFIKKNSATGYCVQLDAPVSGYARFFNNIVIRPTNYTAGGSAFDFPSSIAVVSNCGVFGFTAAPSTNAAASSGSNNATDVSVTLPTGTTGNLTSVPFTTATFTQPSAASALNLRLPSGSTLLNAGLTNAAVTVDAIGTTRPQGAAPDIGIFELPVAFTPRAPVVVFMV